jgi:hypothetical protein
VRFRLLLILFNPRGRTFLSGVDRIKKNKPGSRLRPRHKSSPSSLFVQEQEAGQPKLKHIGIQRPMPLSGLEGLLRSRSSADASMHRGAHPGGFLPVAPSRVYLVELGVCPAVGLLCSL